MTPAASAVLRYAHSMPDDAAADWFFLDDRERDLVARVLRLASDRGAEQAAVLHALLDRLCRVAEVLRDSPSINAGRALPPRAAASEALIDLLCRVPEYDLELHMPTKAVLGQSYLVAKINFFKALEYAISAIEPGSPLQERAQFEVGQSIFSKMAEELFVSILTDPEQARDVKARAAEHLFRIWEERLLWEIDDFAPLLEAAWEARNKVRPVLGTMMGTSELFRLFREARDDRFLDYFGCDDVPHEQAAAFEEFLFGLAHEDVQRLREYATQRGSGVVSADEARRLLGIAREAWAMDSLGPQAMYTSYKERRARAAYRSIARAPGPKKTAEEYVVTSFLMRGLST